MRPNLWRWVGIGMLVALGIAWLTEVWLTTRAPWRPWLGGQPPAMVAPARRAPPPPPARSLAARAATLGGIVIVEHADGTAEQVAVGPGQTVIVGTDGSIHVATGSGTAAIEKRRAQTAEIQAKEAAIKAKMAAAQQNVEAAQQKAMAMGQGAVAIRKVQPPDAQIIYQSSPVATKPDGSDPPPQPPGAAGSIGSADGQAVPGALP